MAEVDDGNSAYSGFFLQHEADETPHTLVPVVSKSGVSGAHDFADKGRHVLSLEGETKRAHLI